MLNVYAHDFVFCFVKVGTTDHSATEGAMRVRGTPGNVARRAIHPTTSLAVHVAKPIEIILPHAAQTLRHHL